MQREYVLRNASKVYYTVVAQTRAQAIRIASKAITVEFTKCNGEYQGKPVKNGAVIRINSDAKRGA
jgi:Zn/Cd-binding protein ZinT